MHANRLSKTFISRKISAFARINKSDVLSSISLEVGETRTEENLDCRGPNVSILHLRNASVDPWEVGSQGSSYSVGSNKSQTAGGRDKSGGNARGSYSRGSSIPSLKRHDTSTSTASSHKQHRQDSHGQVRAGIALRPSNVTCTLRRGRVPCLFIREIGDRAKSREDNYEYRCDKY